MMRMGAGVVLGARCVWYHVQARRMRADVDL
jgi:hypothetical protein